MTTNTASLIRRTAVTLAGLALLAACSTPGSPGPQAGAGDYGASPMPAATSTPAGGTPSAAPVGADAGTLALTLTDTAQLGMILTDGRGMTLYLFTKDSPNQSACEGQCLKNWPPLIGKPTAGQGVDDSKLGSFQRADGRTQATYNGWPLYYWKDDAAPRDVAGAGLQGVWFVLNRDGDAIKA